MKGERDHKVGLEKFVEDRTRSLQWKVGEREDAEAALRDSDEKFRQLADNITDAFWIRSPDMREVHYVSPAFERIWGRSTGSLYANPHQWVDAILPEDRERVLAVFATLTGAASNISIEYRIARPDGEVRWIHVRGFQVRDAASELIRLTGIVTDITDRKRAEKALLESEARHNAIVQSALDCILMIDHEGKLLEFNPAAEKIFGYARAEVLGREMAEVIVPPSLRERHRQGMKRFLSTGEVRVLGKRIEITAMRSDGSEFPVELAITRMGGDGPPTFTGFIRDISERKRAEAELEKVHKELLEASRQVGRAEAATGVLHNVGNVLNSVNVSSTCVADTLRNSKAVNLSKVVALLRGHETDLAAFFSSDPRGRQLPSYLAQLAEHLAREQAVALKELAGLQKNIEHIKDIVNTQQSLAKTSGVLETVKASDLVEDALRMNAGALARQDVQLIREYDPHAPQITVEKHKVLQILVNLIRNAEHACDDSSRSDKRLTVRISNGDSRVRIAVADNGVGIPAENLARIFAHGFTTKKNGHGFGLHSGALAAKELGGSLNVRSEGLGHGATFILELPVNLAKEGNCPLNSEALLAANEPLPIT